MRAIDSFPSLISPALRLRLIPRILPIAPRQGSDSSLPGETWLTVCSAVVLLKSPLFGLEMNDAVVTRLKDWTGDSKQTHKSILGPWQASLIDYCTHGY